MKDQSLRLVAILTFLITVVVNYIYSYTIQPLLFVGEYAGMGYVYSDYYTYHLMTMEAIRNNGMSKYGGIVDILATLYKYIPIEMSYSRLLISASFLWLSIYLTIRVICTEFDALYSRKFFIYLFVAMLLSPVVLYFHCAPNKDTIQYSAFIASIFAAQQLGLWGGNHQTSPKAPLFLLLAVVLSLLSLYVRAYSYYSLVFLLALLMVFGWQTLLLGPRLQMKFFAFYLGYLVILTGAFSVMHAKGGGGVIAIAGNVTAIAGNVTADKSHAANDIEKIYPLYRERLQEVENEAGVYVRTFPDGHLVAPFDRAVKSYDSLARHFYGAVGNGRFSYIVGFHSLSDFIIRIPVESIKAVSLYRVVDVLSERHPIIKVLVMPTYYVAVVVIFLLFARWAYIDAVNSKIGTGLQIALFAIIVQLPVVVISPNSGTQLRYLSFGYTIAGLYLTLRLMRSVK